MKGRLLIGALVLSACSDDVVADMERVTDAAVDAEAPADSGPEEQSNDPRMSLQLATTKEHPAEEPWFNIYRPEDLDAPGEPLPIVVWANGGCFRSDFTWEILFARWASAGYFVLALSEHPEDGAMVQTTVDDQAALVDWAVKQNAAQDSAYFGKLATDRIVAAGNSCGGVTALGLTARDTRISAAFVLSGSSGFGAANRQVIDHIQVPVGYIVGGETDIAGANATSDYDALPNGVPAAIVSRFEGDHRTVSTDAAILTDEAEISLSWMDLAVFGSRAAHVALTSATVCEGCEPGHYTLKAKNLETLLRSTLTVWVSPQNQPKASNRCGIALHLPWCMQSRFDHRA
jgi:predicted dienelactone hydrolase